MDREALAAHLLKKGAAQHHNCVKLSATCFVTEAQWHAMRRHEQAFLRCYAAGLAAPRAVLVGRSAARVANMWVLPTDAEEVELALGGGASPSTSQWPKGVTYRRFTVPDMDLATFRGARLTMPVRTAVDVARLHGVRHGVVAMDGLMHGIPRGNRREVRDALHAVIRRLAGKHGIARAREAFTLSSVVSDSPFESLFRVMLAEHGIVAQEQMWIGDYRVDLLWDNLIIEIDGHLKYADVPHEVLMRQLARENWLKEQGYEVIRLFPAEILKDETACIKRVMGAKLLADARGVPHTPSSPYREW